MQDILSTQRDHDMRHPLVILLCLRHQRRLKRERDKTGWFACYYSPVSLVSVVTKYERVWYTHWSLHHAHMTINSQRTVTVRRAKILFKWDQRRTPRVDYMWDKKGAYYSRSWSQRLSQRLSLSVSFEFWTRQHLHLTRLVITQLSLNDVLTMCVFLLLNNNRCLWSHGCRSHWISSRKVTMCSRRVL